MKANIKFKNLQGDTSGYTKVIGGLVALLLLIVVGLLVYWNVVDSNSSFDDSISETFTSDSDGNSFVRWDGGTTGSNYTGERVKLDSSPSSITSVYVWNGTGSTAQECTVTTHYTNTHKYIDIVADGRSNFTQVNVTYVSNLADTESGVSDMTSTVFGLAPIIALAVVASIIIGVIMAFGGGKKGL